MLGEKTFTQHLSSAESSDTYSTLRIKIFIMEVIVIDNTGNDIVILCVSESFI